MILKVLYKSIQILYFYYTSHLINDVIFFKMPPLFIPSFMFLRI